MGHKLGENVTDLTASLHENQAVCGAHDQSHAIAISLTFHFWNFRAGSGGFYIALKTGFSVITTHKDYDKIIGTIIQGI